MLIGRGFIDVVLRVGTEICRFGDFVQVTQCADYEY